MINSTNLHFIDVLTPKNQKSKSSSSIPKILLTKTDI